jgi:hypothetical protein
MKIELAFAGDSSHAEKMYHTWEQRIRARIAASSASRKSSTREPEDVSEDGDEYEDEDEGKVGWGRSDGWSRARAICILYLSETEGPGQGKSHYVDI